VTFVPGGVSPDRMDAAAHAVNELAGYRGGGSTGSSVAAWSDAPAGAADTVAAWEHPPGLDATSFDLDRAWSS